MAKKSLPSPETLRQLLRYEPDTGKLYWLPRAREEFPDNRSFGTWTSRFCGKEALISTTKDGYKYGAVWQFKVYAHRVIMAMEYGHWPEHDVDHINGVRSDNRRCNLRLATRSENLRNSGIRSDNKTGHKGVCFVRASGKFRAEIAGRSLGYFDTADQASAAYIEAAMLEYGEFAYRGLIPPTA